MYLVYDAMVISALEDLDLMHLVEQGLLALVVLALSVRIEPLWGKGISTIRPRQKACNNLQYLEFLGIGSLECKEM